MRFLDYTNRWLHYGQDAILPFFVFHQPLIMVVAFYVVQWDAGIVPKLLVVVPVSFLLTIGVYELAIRPFEPMRALFGMKSRRRGDSAISPDRRSLPPSPRRT
jgi:hypothetical protein